ncbi:ATP-binding cassette domain-containing protein [Desulfovibrio aminophilus]|uniref:ABC transporter ATP-binding protein n=1 Tax=Desulfovibrio aminophilus TaxID=81425 RepID=UPI0033934FBF
MDVPELVIDVRGITKSFGGKVVVNGLDMQVRRGEIYGFLGPNGSGKTTFIRMLCGLLRPDAGEGTCLGLDVLTEAARIKEQVGYMSQRFSLYEDLTVLENLDFTARMYGLADRRAAVERIVERMGLGRYGKHLAGKLSGGWKQRLALASCILHEPRLLLLDEPTAGVDPGARRDFWDQVHVLAGEGVTALISTHYMDEAERCHRLAYIAYGDLLARGGMEDLIRDSGLTTYTVSGPGLHELARELGGRPGVDQVAAFGLSLHVSGRDQAALETALASLRDGAHTVEAVPTSLEEVFIDLMRRGRPQ